MVTTSDVAESIRGLTFPCTKQQCIAYAKERNATPQVIDLLDKLPDGQFNSLADVWSAIGEVS